MGSLHQMDILDRLLAFLVMFCYCLQLCGFHPHIKLNHTRVKNQTKPSLDQNIQKMFRTVCSIAAYYTTHTRTHFSTVIQVCSNATVKKNPVVMPTKMGPGFDDDDGYSAQGFETFCRCEI